MLCGESLRGAVASAFDPPLPGSGSTGAKQKQESSGGMLGGLMKTMAMRVGPMAAAMRAYALCQALASDVCVFIFAVVVTLATASAFAV